MLERINELLVGPNGGVIVSVFSFLFMAALVLAIGFIVLPLFERRRALAEAVAEAGAGGARSLAGRRELSRVKASRPVESFFRATEKSEGLPDGLELRLFQAGFYSPNAVLYYNISRLAFVAVGFFAAYLLFSVVVPDTLPGFVPFLGALLIGMGCMVIPSILLDVFSNGIKEAYRRSFPDFMDMMITCADAGMSLEAAVGRVSEEILTTHQPLGIQLSIMTLQLRAGKPLREALRDLAERINLEEARTLAVLFRQSEELGTSLVDALRTYSDEMRGQRILRAEERANALPVKLMLPLGLFVFPVVLMIVMLPAMVRILSVFG